MRFNRRLFAPVLLLALLLNAAGAAPLAVAASPPAPAQDDAAFDLHAGHDHSRDGYIIYQNARGEVACREADPAELERISERGPAAAPVVIYRGAPLRRQVGDGREFLTSAAPDDTGLALQPSAGLRIVLHGTQQLEQNQAAKNAFIVAANRWEALVSTPITVVIDVDYGPTFFGDAYEDPNILGAAASSGGTTSLSTARQRLINNSSPTPSELQLYNALPSSSVPVEFNDATTSASSVRLNVAQARALGLVPNITNPDSVPLMQGDAGIGFNSAFNFDFNPDDGITSGTTDFDSVATHEIGHVLGFTSNSGGGSATTLSVWDLFRFRPSAGNLNTFATAPRVMSKGGDQVFFGNRTSTFGGAELQLSTGGPNPTPQDGDGRQSSHWKDDHLSGPRPYIGIMDPTIRPGLRRTISENDIRTLDLLGYSVVFNPQRPANDNFAAARTIEGPTGAFNGTNREATREAAEPSMMAGSLSDKSVWFNWTAPGTGQATFNTQGSGFDTILAVYTGNLGQLVSFSENDDYVSGSKASRVTFNATAGTTYRVAVNGWNGESGNVVLNWQGPSPQTCPTVAGSTFTASPAIVNAGGFSQLAWNVPNAAAGVTITGVNGVQPATGSAGVMPTSTTTYTLTASLPPCAPVVLQATVTVNPAGSSAVRFGSDTYTVLERDGWVGFTVLRSGDASATQQVTITPNPGTADAGADGDYLSAPVNLFFLPGETRKVGRVELRNNQTPEPDEYFTLSLSTPSGAAVGAPGIATVNILDDDTFPANSVSFDGPRDRTVGEGDGKIELTVRRAGDLSRPASIGYVTSDTIHMDRRDYTYAAGTLRFAPGEQTKTFPVYITDDARAEPLGQTFRVFLRDPVGTSLPSEGNHVVIDILDDDAQDGANPLAGTDFFVGQHYLDFLNRQGEADGIAFWSRTIENCGADTECRRVNRVNVSAAFFLSIEFQETGYLVYRAYKAAYGDMPGLPVPVRREEMVQDAGDISRGAVVGVGDWRARLEANKAAFFDEFVARGRFKAAFPAETTPAQFVDDLNRNAGFVLTPAQRDQLVAQLAAEFTPRGRAAALRSVAENSALAAAERSRAFVLMQYFGYMRRNPNDSPDRDYSGWQFWLDQLNRHNGNYVTAELVKAFIESLEYNRRFAQ
ncbi:MAG TPA: NF038122 family metalloprotease [Pyrinomonadaceae bacterium]|nr:NF038122 family metalloprotease [Pyrinomonadaceae bacterium]